MNEDFVSSDEVLNSWKEIAAYLNRGVRTVQRWEIELSLPVRRPRGKSRSAVLALRHELDEWIRSCPLEKRDSHHPIENGFHVEGGELVPGIRQPTRDLVEQAHDLRLAAARARHDFNESLAALMASIQKMAPPEDARAGGFMPMAAQPGSSGPSSSSRTDA